MNLSTNCCKHVLAELKHFHSKDLKTPAGEDDRIPLIPHPPWTPAVISGIGTGTGASIQAVENGDCNDSEDDNVGTGDAGSCESLVRALGEIDQQVVQASRPQKRGRVHVSEYIEAIGSLSQSAQSESKSLEAPLKKPRGNHGFFSHVRDHRARHPRQPDEQYRDYLARMQDEARVSWNAALPELVRVSFC